MLKNEFDSYRIQQKSHPLMIKNDIEAIPFIHESLPVWRNHRAGGIRFSDIDNGIELFGVIDDIWINPQGELIIVDYKATAKQGKFGLNLSNSWNSINNRQVAFYAYLFQRNGFKTHDTGYFVYCIADNDKPALNGKLEFETKVVSYQIDYSWIAKTIHNILTCLNQKKNS